jgi:hypothetical protein
VKAVGKDWRGWFVPLEARQHAAPKRDANLYLYVVDNVRQGDPRAFRLKVFAGAQLTRLLSAAKRRVYYEFPIPVGEFDAAPGTDGL